MANKIYIVDLTDDERTVLLKLIQNGKRSSRKVRRAQILLLADEGRTDQDSAQSLPTSPTTVQRTKIDFAHCMRALVDVLFPNTDKIIIVLDNLNMHLQPRGMKPSSPPKPNASWSGWNFMRRPNMPVG
jgi:hypothetical protein